MFSQDDPVLGGVDLDSCYLFSLALRASRSGADWAEVLGDGQAQGLDLSVVVKDAGAGIDAGVQKVFPSERLMDQVREVLRCHSLLYFINFPGSLAPPDTARFARVDCAGKSRGKGRILLSWDTRFAS